jgi:DNA-binding GntR family transcriptional regulator
MINSSTKVGESEPMETSGGARITARVSAIEHESLRAQVRRVVRTHIVTGVLVPGHRYTIGELAAHLGVSVTPVREALVDLSHHGLIEIIRNRGFVVASVTSHDLDEIFQLRLMIEVFAVGEATSLAREDDVVACQVHVDACKASAAARDLVGFLDFDREFHLRLLSVLGNRRLLEFVDRLRDQTRLYGLPSLAESGHLLSSADEHEALLRAVEARDADEARLQMTQHLNHTRGIWAGLVED